MYPQKLLLSFTLMLLSEKLNPELLIVLAIMLNFHGSHAEIRIYGLAGIGSGMPELKTQMSNTNIPRHSND